MNEDASISYCLAPAVSTDQLRFAVERALTAVAPGSARLGAGPYGSMTGESVARMAAAIAYAFPADNSGGEKLLKGLIWRGIFALNDVVSDSRFITFGRNDQEQFCIRTSLMDAVAGMPMPFGGDVPVDAIYASACNAVAHESIRVK